MERIVEHIMERIMLTGYQGKTSRRRGFHRRYRRENVSGYSCDIADRHRLISGVIDDISSNGFRVSQVSDAFPGDGHSYRTVVSGNGRHYKIVAKPCWQRKTANGLEIGFKILDVSWEWTEFVLEMVGDQGLAHSLEGNA